MKAAQNVSRPKAVSDARVTPGQIAKLIQLVADKEPTLEIVQDLFRLFPDLLRAEKLKEINRYDFCRLIGTPVFKVHGDEIVMDPQTTPITELLLELSTRGVACDVEYAKAGSTHGSLLTAPKPARQSRPRFMVIDADNHVRYDLRIATDRELIEFAVRFAESLPDALRFNKTAHICGYGSRLTISSGKIASWGRCGSIHDMGASNQKLLVTRLTPEEMANVRKEDIFRSS